MFKCEEIFLATKFKLQGGFQHKKGNFNCIFGWFRPCFFSNPSLKWKLSDNFSCKDATLQVPMSVYLSVFKLKFYLIPSFIIFHNTLQAYPWKLLTASDSFWQLLTAFNSLQHTTSFDIFDSFWQLPYLSSSKELCSACSMDLTRIMAETGSTRRNSILRAAYKEAQIFNFNTRLGQGANKVKNNVWFKYFL